MKLVNWLTLLCNRTVLFILSLSLCQPTSLNPLHVAASQGHNYIVECLLQQKVDVNIKDNNGVSVTVLLADSR